MRKSQKQLAFMTERYTDRIIELIENRFGKITDEQEQQSARAIVGVSVATVLGDLNRQNKIK